MLRNRTRRAVLLPALVFAVLLTSDADAQFLGHNLPGDFGLFAGSQAPAGRYAGIIVPYYRADTIRFERAIESESGVPIQQWALAPLLSFVTDFQIFGGSYGFVFVPSFTNLAIELPRLDVEQGQFAVGDFYFVPFQLGWHLDRTDITTSYAFFAPTGRYEVDASDNIGLGMWSHELSVGFTRYFDEAKTWTFATSAFYEIHTKKRDIDVRPGDWLVLEGGLGKSLSDMTTVGAVYYAIWQTTDASGDDVPAPLVGRNARRFGLGPEVLLLQGALTVRALWEFGARNSLEGFTLIGSFALPF